MGALLQDETPRLEDIDGSFCSHGDGNHSSEQGRKLFDFRYVSTRDRLCPNVQFGRSSSTTRTHRIISLDQAMMVTRWGSRREPPGSLPARHNVGMLDTF